MMTINYELEQYDDDDDESNSIYKKFMITNIDTLEKIASLSNDYKNAKRDAIIRTRLPCCIMRQIELF